MAKRKIDYGMAKVVSQGAALTEHEIETKKSGLLEVEVEKLKVNPYQPRIEIREESLIELSTSIKQQGLLQPIVVTKDENGVFIIIAGHRRVEAHKLLQKKFIKAILKEKVVHAQLAILPLVENLQRADTDPIENAIAFKRIIDEKIIKSQQELADLIGVSKSWLSKALSILRLPTELLEIIKKDKYSDVTVLSALNKTDKDEVINIYQKVKILKRKEALDYIRSLVLKKRKQPIIHSFVRNKSRVSIDLTQVKDNKKVKVEILLKEIEAILS